MKTYIIDRAALEHNIDLIQKKAGETPIWAVLKGNGYGLGLIPFARVLSAHGITRFAVTEVSEVQLLRENGFSEEAILMMRPTQDPQEIHALLDFGAILTVSASEDAVALNGIAGDRAAVAEVHLKIDVGMGRYGFLPTQTDQLVSIYTYMKHIAVTGIYTHFPCAFCDKKLTLMQFETFTKVVEELRAAGFETGMVHCCNSSAFWKYPQMYLGGVRIGSAFLGRLSFPGKSGLTPVGFCEVTVEELRWLPIGQTVGYGAGWKAKNPTRVAILSVGWYHGFTNGKTDDLFRFRDCARRILGSLRNMVRQKLIFVTVNGKKCRILGQVGMVHTAVDVTDIECKVGDSVRVAINPLQVKGIPVEFR